jgi:hypothetical protein
MHARRIAKEARETLEMQGVLNRGEGEKPLSWIIFLYQEKESNLRLGLFSCIRRRRVTFVLDFC